LEDVADDGVFGLVVYDDGLTGVADAFEDGEAGDKERRG
jgi:hypothetical protein